MQVNIYSGHRKNPDCHNKNLDSHKKTRTVTEKTRTVTTKIRTATKKIWTFLYKNFYLKLCLLYWLIIENVASKN